MSQYLKHFTAKGMLIMLFICTRFPKMWIVYFAMHCFTPYSPHIGGKSNLFQMLQITILWSREMLLEKTKSLAFIKTRRDICHSFISGLTADLRAVYISPGYIQYKSFHLRCWYLLAKYCILLLQVEKTSLDSETCKV